MKRCIKTSICCFPAGQGGPLVHIIAAKAVCFKEALEPLIKEYQANVIKNAKAMVEVFKQRGYDVVSNGTENHLFLVSFIKQGLTGKAADAALGKANITVNKKCCTKRSAKTIRHFRYPCRYTICDSPWFQ